MEQTSSALPMGWAEYTDPTSGNTFFHNTVTNETTWTRPTAPATAEGADAAAAAAGATSPAAVAGAAGLAGAAEGLAGADASAALAASMGLAGGLGGAVGLGAGGLDAAAVYAAALGLGGQGLAAQGLGGLAMGGGGWTPLGGAGAGQQALQGGLAPGGAAQPAMGGAALGGVTLDPANMKSGTVKLWNEEKGFGFISPAGGGDDVFVHRSTLADGLSLAQGSTVNYEAQWNPQRNKFAVTRCTGAQAGKGGGAGGKGASFPPPAGAQTVENGSMQQGTVKVWYDDKGFGFLIPDGGGEDVFVHRHALTDGQALVQGGAVTFRIAWNEQKGKYLATECTGAVAGQGMVQGKGKGKGVPGYGKAGGGFEMRPAPYPAGLVMMNNAGLPTDPQAQMQAFPQPVVQQEFPQTVMQPEYSTVSSMGVMA